MITPAEEIRARRLKASFSQQEVAKELGISQVCLSLWERGVVVPKPRVVQRVLAVIDQMPSLHGAIDRAKVIAEIEVRKRFAAKGDR